MNARSCLLSVLSLMLLFHSPAWADSMDCATCHNDVGKQKYVHPALKMGCAACHAGIDPSAMPHKKTNKNSKGLSAEVPELCYQCHDKAKFNKKNVHPALEMGCTSCHDPHSSKYPKLLIAEVPDLCMNCHEKAKFTKKNVHEPVAEGACLTCHTPHSSDNTSLLVKLPIRVCLQCHEDVRKTPHATTAFESTGHPIGLLTRGSKEFKDDPARPGKKFYCGSCHNPHSSDSKKLFRYQGEIAMDICVNCHKK